MYLLHTVFGDDENQNKLLKILQSNYLYNSKHTKQPAMYYAQNYSKYIFLRLKIKNDSAQLYLDPRLLLKTIFYINLGWIGDLTEKTVKIDGRKITEQKLLKILTKLKQEAIKNTNNNNIFIPIMMSNEILVTHNINLHKYLKKVYIHNENNKTIKDYIEYNYKNVKVLQ